MRIAAMGMHSVIYIPS